MENVDISLEGSLIKTPSKVGHFLFVAVAFDSDSPILFIRVCYKRTTNTMSDMRKAYIHCKGKKHFSVIYIEIRKNVLPQNSSCRSFITEMLIFRWIGPLIK